MTSTVSIVQRQDGRNVDRVAVAQLSTLQLTEARLIASALWTPGAWQRLSELGAARHSWMASGARLVWDALERHYAASSGMPTTHVIEALLGERRNVLAGYMQRDDGSGIDAAFDANDVDPLWSAYSTARAEQRARELEIQAAARLREGHSDDANELVTEARALRRTAADAWPEPMPLAASETPPAFPVRALPGWLGEWVVAESEALQTPVDLAAMLSLAVLATCVQRRVQICPTPRWREQLCLFVCAVLETGARKSPVFADAFAPVFEYEATQRKELAAEIVESQAKVDIAQKRLDTAKGKAAKDDPSTTDEAAKATALENDQTVKERAKELAEAQATQKHTPQLVCGDVTQEALAILLSQQSERMTLATAEGCGPIAIMLGRYSQQLNVELYLQAFSGDRVAVNRVSKERPPILLERPALTLAVTMQPHVLTQLGEHVRELRDLGFIPRIAFSLPRSIVGYRRCDPPDVPPETARTYADQVRELLDIKAADGGNPHTLLLDLAAKQLFLEFREDLEVKLRPDGEHAARKDWCSKYAGLVLRVAGLLHCADHRKTPWNEHVSADTLGRAIEIGEYMLAHARIALEQIGTSPAMRDAQAVLSWMERTRPRTFSRRDAFRGLRPRFERVDDIDPALEMLTERGWIRERATDRPGPGRKPSPSYEAHPRIYDPGHNGHNGQNGRESSSRDSGDGDSGHFVHSGQGSVSARRGGAVAP